MPPDPFRIDFLLLNGDRAGARVAALQIQRQAVCGRLKEEGG